MVDLESFPILCTKCLGERKFISIIQDEEPRKCKISGYQFISFYWIDHNRNVKRTIISKNIAFLKNVCQICITKLGNGKQKNTQSKYRAIRHTLKPSKQDNTSIYCEIHNKIKISSMITAIKKNKELDLIKIYYNSEKKVTYCIIKTTLKNRVLKLSLSSSIFYLIELNVIIY
mmetsp:Transcript_6844/g.10472  ORF Transcript_6844/g.10472 Transcript_6844/m.10472 type:complete len:173 (-) Transcript_6844:10-528(-)